jgi:hypothetical protein
MATQSAQFVTIVDAEFIMSFTDIDRNIDGSFFSPNILQAQQQHIRFLLGDTLYQKILSDIASGYIYQPADSNYLYLLQQFLQPTTAYYAYYFIICAVTNRTTNKSLQTKTSQNAQPGNMDQRAPEVLRMANQFAQDTWRYINNNLGFYPEYFQINNPYQITPISVQYTNSGILTRRRRGYNGRFPGYGQVPGWGNL